MSSYNCTCFDKTTGIISQPGIIVSSCSECSDRCGEDEMVCETRNVPKIDVETFLILLVIQIVLFFVMASFSFSVLSQCKWKPRWLIAFVVLILIAWVAIGWYPGVGLGLGFIMFILLMIYYVKCSKKVPKKKMSKEYFV